MSLTAMATTHTDAGNRPTPRRSRSPRPGFSSTAHLCGRRPARARRRGSGHRPASGRGRGRGTTDCMAALEAAVAAQGSWAATAPRDRSRVLRRASDRLRDEAETLALVTTAEAGKPLAESRAEVEFAADYLEWFAEEAVRIAGRTSSSPDGRSRHLVVRAPVGPCLVVSPWNFPLAVRRAASARRSRPDALSCCVPRR